MKRSILLSLALTLLFTGLSMSVVFADELEAEEAVISETTIDGTDIPASEESIEISTDEVSDDDLTADTEELIDTDNMAMHPIEGDGTAGETVTDGVYEGVINADGTVTVTGLVNDYEDHDEFIIPSTIEGRIVTIIGDGAFYNCRCSNKLLIPDTVTKIGDMAFCNFRFSYGLVIGKNVKTIGDKAFYNCDFNYNSYMYDDYLIVIPDSVEIIGESAFEDLPYSSLLLQLGQNVRIIKDRAFYNNTFYGDLIIPDSVTTIGDEAFSYSNEYDGGDIWDGKLVIGKNVKSIGKRAFRKCSFEGDLTIPGSVATIGDEAFADCTNITGKLTLGKGVKSIGPKAFNSCLFQGNLTIPDSVKTIAAGAFGIDIDYDSDTIGTLSIGENVTKIGSEAFYNRPFKGSLIIPNKVTDIGSNAFDSSGFTKNLIIGGSVKSIGSEAFNYCGFEGKLTIPKSVKHLDESAFYDCHKIRKIVNKSNKKIPAYNFLGEYADEFSYFTDNKGKKIDPNDMIGKGTYIRNPIKVREIELYTKDMENDVNKITMRSGEINTLTAVVWPDNAFNKKVRWKSSNSKIVSVSSKGVIKALKLGTAVISATAVDGSKTTAECKITVKKPIKVKSIKIDKIAVIYTGDITTLEPKIQPGNATNKEVTWESSDLSIAMVSSKGFVKGISPGVAYITVKTVDGNKTAKCKLIVK